MLRTGTTRDGKRYITGRDSRCVRYFIDGWRQTEVSATDLAYLPDSYLSTAELGAIEVYSPMTAPGEFFATSLNGDVCFSVVIWTKFKNRRSVGPSSTVYADVGSLVSSDESPIDRRCCFRKC